MEKIIQKSIPRAMGWIGTESIDVDEDTESTDDGEQRTEIQNLSNRKRIAI